MFVAEMGQVNNLDVMNKAVQLHGATHVFNFKVTGTSNITGVYPAFKKVIESGNLPQDKKWEMDMTGNRYTVRWVSTETSTNAYYYTVSEIPDIIMLAHTRMVVQEVIRQVYNSLYDDLKEQFSSCNLVYSVTKTAGQIDRVSVKDVLSSRD